MAEKDLTSVLPGGQSQLPLWSYHAGSSKSGQKKSLWDP